MIALIVLGFPLWLPLLAAAFAVLLSVYVVLWSLVISLWAVEVALWASVLGSIAGGAILLFTGRAMSAAAVFGAALICAGLSIFLFFGSKAAAKGALLLGKCTLIAIKKSFARKETEA